MIRPCYIEEKAFTEKIFMTKKFDLERIKDMCETFLIRAVESGDLTDFEDLYLYISHQVKILPEDEKIELSRQEIAGAVIDAKADFDNTCIFTLPEEDDFVY